MLRFGPDTGPTVIAALPLFEEANRTRALTVAVLHRLAEHGIPSVLPDLPGQGESIVPTCDADLGEMRDAYDGVVAQASLQGNTYGMSIRSGALIDPLGLLCGRWQLAPQSGENVLRELGRVRHIATGEPFDPYLHFGDRDDPPVEFGGNLVSPWMLTGLVGAAPFDPEYDLPLRIARMESDPAKAHVKFLGSPPWRSSEPLCDIALARFLADDIAAWIATCEA